MIKKSTKTPEICATEGKVLKSKKTEEMLRELIEEEMARAMGAEQGLQDNIDAEKVRALGAER